METTTFISNVLVIVMVPICTAVLWWRQHRYIKQLKAITKEFNDAITEAVSVRDEIQSLFDEFEEKLDAENDKEKRKLQDEVYEKSINRAIEFSGQSETWAEAFVKRFVDEDENAESCEKVLKNEPTKYKYLIRVKLDYFRHKFPDFDSMSQQKKDDLMEKEFEYITSILKSRSDKLAIFFNENFEVDEWNDDVEIYPLEDGEEVKVVTEEGIDNDPALARRLRFVPYNEELSTKNTEQNGNQSTN